MKFNVLVVILMLSLIIPFAYLEPINQSLDFDVIKTKYMDVNVSLQTPIYIDRYSENGSFTLTTPVFINSRNQTVTLEAYYLEAGQKIPATFTEDEYGNRFAVFEVSKITKGEYIFYIDAKIISENKIVFSEDIFSLENKIEEYKEYTLPTRYINSDRSEIISTSRFIRKSDNALKELTNIINWTYNYVEYDISYSEKVVEAVNVLAERKGVCSEFSILAASLLRERGFPTRYVTGYANSTLDWQAHAWLEIYIPGQGWIFADPTFGEVGLVDASHLLISRAFDPSEIKDRVTAYGDVTLRFGEKKADFKINEHKSYSDLGYSNTVNVDFSYPEKIKEGSAFFITAKITNTTSRAISMLFMLSIHSDFTLIYPENKYKIMYLEPFKEEEISFYLVADNVYVPSNYYKTYGFNLKSQVSDFSGNLEVYKNEGYFQEAFFVTDPLFYLDKDVLNLSFDVINYTNVIKSINLDFNNNGSITNQLLTVPSNTVSNFSRKFNVTKESRFTLDLSQDYSSSQSYYIYDDKVIVIEKDVNVIEETLNQGGKVDDNSLVSGKVPVDNSLVVKEYDKGYLKGIFVVLGFIILTLIVYLINHKRKEE